MGVREKQLPPPGPSGNSGAQRETGGAWASRARAPWTARSEAWAGARAAAEVEFESISCADGSVIGLRIFMPSGDLVEAEV